MTVIEEVKQLLSENRYRIRLHDLLAQKIREVLSLTSEDNFPVGGGFHEAMFAERLKKYEEITTDLCKIQALLTFWGTEAHRDNLILPTKRICTRLTGMRVSSNVLLALRWYPALLLLYSGGIAAVAAKQYENLGALMQVKVPNPERTRGEISLIDGVGYACSELRCGFKKMKGHEKYYAPRSEYLFKLLQPALDDLLFMGPDYESHFDVFEVLFALKYAENHYPEEGDHDVWAPTGRFGWKKSSFGHSDPLKLLIEQLKTQGVDWPPIKAGVFKLPVERFTEMATKYNEIIRSYSWH